MENYYDFQEEYKKLDNEAAKYNRQEFDIVYEIISEMVKGRDDVGDNRNNAFPLVEGEIIDEAIKRAGFSKDEAFISDFKHYRDIEQKARNLQLQAIEQANKYMNEGLTSEEAMQKAGLVKSMELQEIMDNVVFKAKEENSYFPYPIPFGDVKKEDEELDLLLGTQGFDITYSCLLPYLDELKRYRVDELLHKIGFPLTPLFSLIKETSENIKNNSDKSIAVRNDILDVLNKLNEYPGSGQVVQLLFLLGLIKWFEGCDINEGDKDYNEAKYLHDNIFQRFMEIYVFYNLYLDKDKHSKPLDEFLANDKKVISFKIAMRNMSNASDKVEMPNPDQSNDYEIKDYDNIQAIFNLCNNEFFETNFIIFRESIEKADFRKIKIKRQTITQDLIYRLSGIFGKDWLNKVEDTMEWKKGICSGRNDKVKEYPVIKRLDKLISRPAKKAD